MLGGFFIRLRLLFARWREEWSPAAAAASAGIASNDSMHPVQNSSSSLSRTSGWLSSKTVLRTLLGAVMLFLLALLTRNLYAHLATLGSPLHVAVNEEAPRNNAHSSLEVHHEDDDVASTKGSSNTGRGSIFGGDYDPRRAQNPMKDRRWLDDRAAMKHSDRRCICPQIVHCRDESIEEACLRYMANYTNVVSLRFDGSILSRTRGGKKQTDRNARAPTFLVQFSDPCVRGIARARTELLPHAPESEYLAYDFDRSLHFYRVPPTTILWLPVSMVRSSTADKKEQGWIEKMVLAPSRRRGAIIKHTFAETGKEEEILYVSVQLFIFSMRPGRGTPLHVHDELFTLLRNDDLYRRATHYVMERYNFVDPANMYLPDGSANSGGGSTAGGGADDDNNDNNPAVGDGAGGDSKKKRRKRIRWKSNRSSNLALTSEKIGSLLVDYATHAQKKLAFHRRVQQHHHDKALQGDYGLAEQQKAEAPTVAAGGVNDPENPLGEDVADFGARAHELTDEANRLADILLVDEHLPQSFPVVMSYMSDRAVFDAVINSDVSPSLHGGEGPSQIATSRVYLLRADQVPPQCLGRAHPEDVVEIDNRGEAKFFQAPRFFKHSHVRRNKPAPLPDDDDIAEAAQAMQGKRFLMPVWVGNQGCLRRRGFLTPSFRGADPSVPGSMCLFRGRTWRVINQAASNDGKTWRSLLRRRVPAPILARLGSDKVFTYVEERLKHIVEHQSMCMVVLGQENHVCVW